MFATLAHSLASDTLDAIRRSQAMIDFAPDGIILDVNDRFLSVVGYDRHEVVNRHHSLFLTQAEAASVEYRAFWEALRAGEHRQAEFRRQAKGGREVWIQANYIPVTDKKGRVVRVVKVATDITADKLRQADFAGQIAAINKSQAVIEFTLDGVVLAANPAFLGAMGYSLEAVVGQHHRMFVTPAERDSVEYRAFWDALRRGGHACAEFKRLGEGGREVWIQATYNPICDADGRPFKVVRFATDITQQKLQAADHAGQIAGINKSQAVIQFSMDGTILTANEIFLQTMGYTLAEVQGRHHSLFVDSHERDGAPYAEFWAALRTGHHQQSEFKRLGEGGREVWIQATYTPILDVEGRPFKVVKFATDITAQVRRRQRDARVRDMMNDVAAGAEELSASVREIAANMAASRDSAEAAVDSVGSADQATERLSSAAQAMSGVVSTIHEITGQINLLALNATIEAARAGEAGRGFAVVASEVKSLANQAKAATESISAEIASLRGVSAEVVSGLAAVKAGIERLREYVTSTAAAVEEQSAVAGEMSASMQRAASEAAAA